MNQAPTTGKQACDYPACSCPFDAPADPNWCALRLPKARPLAAAPLPPPPMADMTYGCSEHYYDGCPNCCQWHVDGAWLPQRSMLASRAFWIGGALSVAVWAPLLWALREWLR